MCSNCDVFGQHSVPSEALGNEALRKKDTSLQCSIPPHEGHQLADDSFALSVPNEFQKPYRLAVKYRSYMLLYSVSRRLIQTGDRRGSVKFRKERAAW